MQFMQTSRNGSSSANVPWAASCANSYPTESSPAQAHAKKAHGLSSKNQSSFEIRFHQSSTGLHHRLPYLLPEEGTGPSAHLLGGTTTGENRRIKHPPSQTSPIAGYLRQWGMFALLPIYNIRDKGEPYFPTRFFLPWL